MVGDALLAALQSAGMSFMITIMGFGGGLVMSAIKRDRGVKDYGSMIQGHGGVLDRIGDSVSVSPRRCSSI